MKLTLSLTLAMAMFTSVMGAYAGGKKNVKHFDSTSKLLKPGQYRFVNAKSGWGLTYVRAYQQLYATKGKGSWMSLKVHHHHVVISPSQSNNKCMSAQWNYKKGANWAGALYACSVTKFKRDGIPEDKLDIRSIAGNSLEFAPPVEKRDNATLAKRAGLRADKQYWYVHPGTKKHTYHIVAQDHLGDMPPTALADCHVSAVGQPKAKYGCLVKLNDKDASQLWYVYNKAGKRV